MQQIQKLASEYKAIYDKITELDARIEETDSKKESAALEAEREELDMDLDEVISNAKDALVNYFGKHPIEFTVNLKLYPNGSDIDDVNLSHSAEEIIEDAKQEFKDLVADTLKEELYIPVDVTVND